jgi:hypothetical protein
MRAPGACQAGNSDKALSASSYESKKIVHVNLVPWEPIARKKKRKYCNLEN